MSVFLRCGQAFSECHHCCIHNTTNTYVYEEHFLRVVFHMSILHTVCQKEFAGYTEDKQVHSVVFDHDKIVLDTT